MLYFAHRMREEDNAALVAGVHDRVVFGPLRGDGGYVQALQEAEMLVCPGGAITAELINHCSQVRWIHSVSAGVERAPFALLRERGIQLSNSRGIHGKPIAEQALGMMIAFSRGLHANWQNQRERKWERVYPLSELTEKTLCIVGSGSIGREVARKAKAFDLRVVGVKRTPEPLPNHDDVFGFEQLDAALAVSDYVLVLTPLTETTFHLFDRARFARMKPSAVFLNFSRGDVVDEAALIEALQSGQIAGAGLDVFHEEPLPPESPLWSMDQVLISPHNGGWTPHHNRRLVPIILDNYHAYREGRPLPTGVDLERGY
ncbi:D-2-hydroxyacid dehydrogenase [Alicyclobacillus shizuokensis]|uniref:D-2-hydroxyacid dehydrogenase n=1 Tax=Alicyclobacillus shizuokensis TaxID=392014 RepID=UPI00083707E0|nr:D-2-hydroxyacid dehydrogenase [Alicyclobacillus shizuokensis]MCL6625368.1 D-2-hydroxyacid dehydrogenase [Alicyclobacillus shizuokensis]